MAASSEETGEPAARSSRARILEKALMLFAAEGYPHVSMRRIADEAGIRPATLYHHFTDKEALYGEVLRNFYKDMGASLAASTSGEAEPVEAVRAYVRHFACFAANNRHFIKLIKREQMEENPAHLRFMVDELFNAQLHAIAAPLAALFPGLDGLLLAHLMHGMILHLYEATACHALYPGWRAETLDPDFVFLHITTLLGVARPQDEAAAVKAKKPRKARATATR